MSIPTNVSDGAPVRATTVKIERQPIGRITGTRWSGSEVAKHEYANGKLSKVAPDVRSAQ